MSKRSKRRKSKLFVKLFKWLAVNLFFPLISLVATAFVLSLSKQEFEYLDLASGSELYFLAFLVLAGTTVEFAFSGLDFTKSLFSAFVFLCLLLSTFIAAVLFGGMYAVSVEILTLDYDRHLAAQAAIIGNFFVFGLSTPIQFYVIFKDL